MNGVPAYHISLLRKANVVGVGYGEKVRGSRGTGDPALSVLVERKLPRGELAPQDIVPAWVGALPTDVVEVGCLRAPPPFIEEAVADERRDVMRPARPGCSVGHVRCTAGTYGLLVARNLEGVYAQPLMLSNNHVFGMSNDAEHGDHILQPGPYDGGMSDNQIAFLSQYVPINFSVMTPTCRVAKCVSWLTNAVARVLQSRHRLKPAVADSEPNNVDAALGWPLRETDVSPDILDIGRPAGIGDAFLGTKVQKSGRTTGHTTGEVSQMNATVRVNYGNNRTALFVDQFVAVGDDGQMSAGGDSGSAVLDSDGYVVGLLFAGSPQVTIFNPIEAVMQSLNIRLWTR